MIIFEPNNKTFKEHIGRVYEVETHEDQRGDVVVSIGGVPVLYFSATDRCLHIVPNDVRDNTGLLYEAIGHYPIIVKDATR